MNDKNEIIRMMQNIKVEYGNDSYVDISGDSSFEHVSHKLLELWYSDKCVSIRNIDTLYHRSFDMAYPEYGLDDFATDLLELQTALAQEFEELSKANNTAR